MLPEVSRGFQRFPEGSRGFQRFTEVSRGFQRFTEVSRGFQRFTEVYRGLQRFTDVYSFSLVLLQCLLLALYRIVLPVFILKTIRYFRSKRRTYFDTLVGDYINIMKTTFYFIFYFLTSFFELQVYN